MDTKTKSLLDSKGVDISKFSKSDIIGAWWTFEIINIIVGRISMSAGRPDTLNSASLATIGYMVVDIIFLVDSIISIKLVNGYSKLERMLLEIKVDEPQVENIEANTESTTIDKSEFSE